MFRRPALTSASGLRSAVAGRLGVANVIGAGVVFYYLTYVSPNGLDTGTTGIPLPYVVTMLVYLGVVVPWVTIAGLRTARGVQAWLKADRPATPQEKRELLAQPWIQTRLSFRAWLGAAVVFSILNVNQGVGAVDCVRVAIGIVLGGLTTCAISFLLVERVHRPAFALALADGEIPERRGLGLRDQLLLMWLLGSGIPFIGVLLAPTGRPSAEREDLVAPVLVLAGIGLITGALVTFTAARSLVDPLDEVRHALDHVAKGELDVTVPVDVGGELGELEAGFNRMVEGLREKERLADLFGRHVGVEVARRAIEGGAALGGQLREVSVLFVDIIGSTSFAEHHPPDVVIALLNEFFSAVVTTVEEGGGWVNKFDGDGALCAWGRVEDDPDHATRALSTARALCTALNVLRARHPELDAGIGLSSGTVVAGNLGARSRFEYTVIGDPVNEASRLTDLAKGEPTRVLAAGAALRAAQPAEQAHWKCCGQVTLRGRTEPSEAWTTVDHP